MSGGWGTRNKWQGLMLEVHRNAVPEDDKKSLPGAGLKHGLQLGDAARRGRDQLVLAPWAIQEPIRSRSAWVIWVMLPSGMIWVATA